MRIGNKRHEGRIQLIKMGHWNLERVKEFGEEDEYSVMGRVGGYDLSKLIKVDLHRTNLIFVRRDGPKVLREDGNFIETFARHEKLWTKKHSMGGGEGKS